MSHAQQPKYGVFKEELVHVLPINDIREHVSSPNCPCHPKQDDFAENLWIHNAWDLRERYEGIPKQ